MMTMYSSRSNMMDRIWNPTTAAPFAWSCRNCTSIRARNGSTVLSLWSVIALASGSSAAIITMLIPGKRSDTGKDSARLSMFRRKQKLTRGIMRPIALQGEFTVLHGIAIDAAMRAGIVLAYVFRGETAALFAIALLTCFSRDRLSGNSFNAVGINTTRFLYYSRYKQFFLRTASKLHVIGRRDMSKVSHQLTYLLP